MIEITDTLANAITKIKNNEDVGKKECVISPASKTLGNVLNVLQKEGYIGEYEYIDNNKGGKYRIELKGNINKCKAIKPRYPIKKDEYKEYEKKYLPGQGIGTLIVSTPFGVMTQKEAEKRKTGGRMLAYVY